MHFFKSLSGETNGTQWRTQMENFRFIKKNELKLTQVEFLSLFVFNSIPAKILHNNLTRSNIYKNLFCDFFFF